MIIFKKTLDIKNYLLNLTKDGRTVGFVPTMGALHPGHISLIKTSITNNNITVCSIFVNPTQFNDKKDFDNYPSTLESDIDELEKAGCAVLFIPDLTEIFPDDIDETEIYELGYLETVLEGEFRPGHFQGVCNVVDRLLNIITCHHLYLGQKDYQQCMVLKKLIEFKKIDIKIIICPTLRESDGLAMSSRNIRLTNIDRKKALMIFETLSFINKNIKPGNLHELQNIALTKLTTEGFKVDYVAIANADNLELIKQWDGKTKLVALIAVFMGDVRLIDNMLLQAV